MKSETESTFSPASFCESMHTNYNLENAVGNPLKYL